MLIYLSLIETDTEKRKFERLYINYRQRMYFSAFRILNNAHDAEDAVHKAFMRVIDHLDKIDDGDEKRTKAFLIVITEHIAIDIYRKENRIKKDSYEELEVYISDNASEASSENKIISCIMKLPVNYSTVLRLKYAQGYNDSEIAQILGISEANVRQRISRGKKKLSQLLKEEGIIYE